MFFVNLLNRFIDSGEKRSVRIKRNIIFSFLIRSLSVGINLLIVSLAINYVDPVNYGIWLLLTSIISWFTFFDFGMGNGLRNKLAAAIASNKYEEAKKYISTTYAIFILIALGFFLVFLFVNPSINWDRFLNIKPGGDQNIHAILLIVVGVFCIQFVLQLLNIVLTSLQEPAKAELITLLGQGGALVSLIILKYTLKGSLEILVIALNIAPLAFILLASLLLYTSRYKLIAPSLKNVDFRYSKNILNLGGNFFLIQVGALILFQTDNIIITNVLGPEAVTKFNVAYKLYSIIIMAFSIIATPYWSAFTEAYTKNDNEWISKSVKRLREIWLFVSVIIVPLFLLLAKYLFKIWLPDTINIDFSLSISMAGYAVCYTCLTLNCYFLNGIGKLRIQLLLYFLVAITNVPLGIILGKALGIEGVILSNIITFVFMNIVLWIQSNRILQNKAFGIWNA